MKNWYLIQTKPQQEAVASQNLSNQGYDIFHPKAMIKNKSVSLFPRYLFIHLDDKNQNWTPIRSTPGVLAPLVGQKSDLHVKENLQVLEIPPFSEEEFNSLLKKLTQ